MLPSALRRKFFWRFGSPFVLAGVAYGMYKHRLASNAKVTPEEFHKKQEEAIQQVLASAETLKHSNLVLYQYTTCPYCNKIRTFLDSQHLKYKIVEVDPLFKKELTGSGYGKVPHVQFVDGPRLVDSEAIIDYFAPLLLPKEAVSSEEVLRWRRWANDVLARYLVINTNRNWAESFRGYDYVYEEKDFGLIRKILVKIVGGISMHIVSEQITKKRLADYGYEKGQDEWEALSKEMGKWGEALQGDFHGGKRPDLADLEVYGILQSVRLMPVYEDIKNCKSIRQWTENMEKVVSPTE